MPIRVDLRNLPKLVNDKFYPLFKDTNRYLVLYGGAGSGKSWFAAQKIIVRCLTEPGHRFLCIRKVAKTIRESVFALIRETINNWGLSRLVTINKSNLSFQFINGSEIITAGIDDPEKLKSIFGITGMWIEEASEITPDDFNQLDLRLRGHTPYYKQIILSFNPISEMHWLKKYFFDRKREGATIVHSTYLDNKFIDDHYRQVLEELKETDPVYYAVYALGQWGSLGNLVYSNYVIEDLPTDPKEYPVVYYGMDFGFNDPTAINAVGIKDDEVYVFDEFHRTKLTNTDLIREAGAWGLPKDRIIVADSAEPDRIMEFMRAGYTKIQPADKRPGSIKAGIDFLRGKKIHIASHCTHTIKEIQGYKYKEDKDGNVLEEPVDFNNHHMDAIRYAVQPWRMAVGGRLMAVKRF